jgi:hypothetical protein
VSRQLLKGTYARRHLHQRTDATLTSGAPGIRRLALTKDRSIHPWSGRHS